MKQVIILQGRGLSGGACESIKLLIENIGHPVDLIVQKGDQDYITKRMIKQFYGDNVNRVFEFYLPYSLANTKGGGEFDIDAMQRKNRLFRKNRGELYKFLKEQKYDHIHLNGLGLYPVLSRKYPMTIHIRQTFDGNIMQRKIIEKYLLRAKGVIYIDSATKEPFKHLKVNSLLISNPIDQTQVNTYDRDKVMEEYGFAKDDVIFTIAGTLLEVKGQEFLIHAFEGFNEYPYKLLIAGDGKEEIKRKYNRLAENNPNIIFLGQVPHDEMFKVYRITDYIIRAGDTFRVGRTVHEGLYSGTGLIIQGEDKDSADIKDYTMYKDKIYFYTPRDIQKFRDVLYTIGGKKLPDNYKAVSNAPKYARIFNKYIDKIIFKSGE